MAAVVPPPARRSSRCRAPTRAWAIAPALVVTGLVVTALAAPAVAQRRPSADEVKAAAAFDRGRALLKAGDWDGACAAFADSERLAPAVGTELNLAPCLARAGQLLAAVELLVKAEAGAAALGDAAKLARARADLVALRARIPTVVARVPAGRTIGLTIDGAAVAAPTAPTPVDPGPRVLTIAWSGGPPIERTVVLAEGEALVLEAPPIEVAPIEVAPVPARAVPPRSGRRIAAYAVGGVGLAALVGGAAALAIGLGDRAEAEDLAADPGAGADRFARASALHADGTTTANLGVGLMLGGGAAVVGATYLWLTGGRTSTAPTVAVGRGGLVVGYAGAF